jgi:hypothetical protein
MEAIERPRPAVPIKTDANESGLITINPILRRHPARLDIRIEPALKRAAAVMISIRPMVNEPQNNDVRYAAVVALLMLSLIL